MKISNLVPILIVNEVRNRFIIVVHTSQTVGNIMGGPPGELREELVT